MSDTCVRSTSLLLALLLACDGSPVPASDAGQSPRQDGGPLLADGPSPPPPPDQGAPSANGCGKAVGANDLTWKVDHGGRERTFVVHLPQSYDPARPTPVVINFHGRTMSAQQQILVTGMHGVADTAGFIAVHPSGVGATWNAGLCCGEAQSQNVDDVGFTRAILDRLDAALCIDPRRIYATGLSNGGYMAHRLACELSDRIVAIGPVAGTNGMLSCSPGRPVAVLHFHGTDDAIVPWDGFAGFTSVPASMQGWVERNGCGPQSKVVFQQSDVSCEEWTGCKEDATVGLCTIDGGGHQWPGGMAVPGLGHNTSAISASQQMWSFFSGHAR